jgi:hypothetical protein
VQHRHSDLSDRVILYGSVLGSLLCYWGASFFVQIVTIVPAGLLIHVLMPSISSESFRDIFMSAWLGLSVPMAIALTWLRSRRVREGRLVIDAEGIEHHWYPWRPVRIAWKDVKLVRTTRIPNTRQARVSLIIESARRSIVVDSDDWNLKEIEADIEPHFAITRNKPGR